ncbi:ABC transporter permease [Candidatus Poribacteria bacterium]|nr:ABC transporter permease [Candidatus Poribacteria bacterium]
MTTVPVTKNAHIYNGNYVLSALIKPIEKIGQLMIVFFTGLGEATRLTLTSVKLAFQRPYQFQMTLRQCYIVGVTALPVVIFTGIFTGLLVATQGYHQLKLFSAEGTIGGFVSVTIIKELGLVVPAFVMAGRIGASITAELGTMKVTEQIDALEVMAVDPVKYLVVPRLVACSIMLPALTLFSIAFGIGGAYYVVIKLFDMNGNFFWKNLKSFMYLSSVVVSVVKAISFGISIAIVGCYKGFSVSSSNGAEGVGRATTGSAVTAIMIILIIDFLLNHLLYAILGFK